MTAVTREKPPAKITAFSGVSFHYCDRTPMLNSDLWSWRILLEKSSRQETSRGQSCGSTTLGAFKRSKGASRWSISEIRSSMKGLRAIHMCKLSTSKKARRRKSSWTTAGRKKSFWSCPNSMRTLHDRRAHEGGQKKSFRLYESYFSLLNKSVSAKN